MTCVSDDCLRLPSQVMIPPLNLFIRPRGVAVAVVNSNPGSFSPLRLEFGLEPAEDSPFAVTEGGSTSVMVDSVKQTYLGRDPYAVRQCYRYDPGVQT